MTWLEDYCFVCDKVCPAGSIYCSETCKLHDYEKARAQGHSAPVSPPLLPVQSSASESGRRSSAVQVQVEMSPPTHYFVPFYEKGHGSHDLYYGRLQSGTQQPRYTSAVPRRHAVAPNTLLYGM
ncbi:hypothetical protein V1504DRAFT_434742 [Lipomyces starkeyi]